MGNIVYSHKFHHRPGNWLALLQFINKMYNNYIVQWTMYNCTIHNYILWLQAICFSHYWFDSVMMFSFPLVGSFLFGGIHLDWTHECNYSDTTWKHHVQDFSCQNCIYTKGKSLKSNARSNTDSHDLIFCTLQKSFQNGCFLNAWQTCLCKTQN